MMLDIDVCVL